MVITKSINMRWFRSCASAGVHAFACAGLSLFIANSVEAGLAFSVKSQTDFGIQGADFSYRVGRLEPFIGFDAWAMGVSGSWSNSSYITEDIYDPISATYIPTHYRSYDYSFEGEGSATLLVPSASMRVALMKGALEPYLFANGFKTFAILKANWTYEGTYYDEDGNLTDKDYMEVKNGKTNLVNYDYDSNGVVANISSIQYDASEEKKELARLLSPWGIGVGFGTSYEFNEHFLLFAEIAFKMYFTNSDFKKDYDETTIIDSEGSEQWKEEWEHKFSGSIKLVSSNIGVKFAF